MPFSMRNKELICRPVVVVNSALLLFCQGIDVNFFIWLFNSNETGKGALVIPEEIPESDKEEEKIPVKARKNAGRKSPWSQHQLDDFVDIIVANEDYKKKPSCLETLNSKEMGSYMAKLSWNWSRDVLPGDKLSLFQLINSDQNSRNVLVNANELH